MKQNIGKEFNKFLENATINIKNEEKFYTFMDEKK